MLQRARLAAIAHRLPMMVLGNDELQLVAESVDANALFPLAATCRALRAAVAARCPALGRDGTRTTTSARYAYGHSVALAAWARANGCTWGERTCALAARGGHLHVLQWARANG